MTAPDLPRVRLVVLGGDGIGPEVARAAVRVLRVAVVAEPLTIEIEEHPIGGAAIDAHGEPLPPQTLAACLAADAVFLGAVGDSRFDRAPKRPESALLGLRKALGVFANLRPVRAHPALADTSPLRAEKLRGVDLLFVRELVGGLYFGTPRGRTDHDGMRSAVDTLLYDEHEIRRTLEVAFRAAEKRKRKVTQIDKANVLATSALWREVAEEVARDYPNVTLEHQLVDSAALRLLTDPASFDVLVTENLFGDILTDEAAALAGSLGLLPSASIGSTRPGLFEPVHGSAPDLAGRDLANPLGAILSMAMLLRHGLELEAPARAIERAVDDVLASGARTRDLGGEMATSAMTAEVLARLGG